ncbi:MAG: AarF/ABC1/UbiB kinase family protein [Eggerthellaceae bacterium]|nr:AarF/ABC1/UbiB kinase family protein [Eggerthellaceae bacterium]
MPSNTLVRHFFGQGTELDPEDRFELSRKTRSRGLREIASILMKHHFLRGFTPVEFRTMLEDLGPSFVKIGQTLSTRSEILPQAYCDELAKLQTECDPLPFEEVKKALFGIYHDEEDHIFAKVYPEPLGSASLAQVHKAQLASTGEIVAIKVQRPGVRTTMALDIDIMRIMARRVQAFSSADQMIDFSEVVEELWRTFLQETDFLIEAENLQLFHQLNKDVAFIDCPRVYPELCSENCLVMEYIEGIPISDHEALLRKGYNLPEIGEKMLDNYATQILDHGFFHADPHPGNIIVRDGKVVYIDLGIMGRLSPAERGGFNTIIHAVGLQDPGKLKDALLSFAVSRDNAAIDHPRLLADLDLLLATYASCDLADLDIGQFLADVLAVTRVSKVTLPTSVANVSRGIVTMEGTLADFIANDNILSIINSHITRTSDPIEAVQDLLQDTLLEMRKASEGAAQAAAYSGEALRMLTRGQLKVNMEVLGSEEPIAGLSKIMNRLTIGIIIAGLFIGSALYSQFSNEATIWGVPVISFFGFLGAFILSVWVIVDIWRK